MERRATLSLTEWAVVACLVDRPRHGYDIAGELSPGTELGTVWRVERPLVYRALDRLVGLGLAEPQGPEPGGGGPPRRVHAATAAGRARLDDWLATPLAHLREVRSALLLKLVVARRLGRDIGPLVDAQRTTFAATLDALASAPPRHDPVALWRHHSATAVRSLLDDLGSSDRD